MMNNEVCMRRVIFALLAAGTVASTGGAQRPPSTDIFLAPLRIEKGAPVIGPPINITNRPGYDNQPSFTSDGRAILFTSVHDDGQSDIYRYDVGSKQITRVTSTPESEYSATVMSGGNRFSVIRVEKDSTQRLWSFAIDGSDPRLILENIKPVGYHAWIDAENLALFVLGSPNALVLANARNGQADTITRNIGRSLHPLADGSGFSYLQRTDSSWTLTLMSWPAKTSRAIATLPRGSEDVAWLSRDLVVASSGSDVFYWAREAATWRVAANLADRGLGTITRMAVSPDGQWLAIVAVPRP
jgi:dipeptidyl aminopeptidase/acylaminoacyl peptidase